MRATPRWPHPVNLRPTPWLHSANRRNRDFDKVFNGRIILFLLLIALGAARPDAEQTGDVVLSWGGYRAQTTLPVFVLAGIVIVAAVIVGDPARPGERRNVCGAAARTASGPRPACDHQGLLAIGHGDSGCPHPCRVARKHAAHDPLALLLHAQSAQLDGDREGAQRLHAWRTRTCGCWACAACSSRRSAPTSVAAVMAAEER
jgi:HemY protein